MADADVARFVGIHRVRIRPAVPQELAELQNLSPVLLWRAGQAESGK